MTLTGQAKKDFKKWIKEQCIFLGINPYEGRENKIEELGKNFQYTLMIEWFDSVGIFINTVYEEFEDRQVMSMPVIIKAWSAWILSRYEDELIIDFKTRLEATSKAIEKANEIYNQRFKK